MSGFVVAVLLGAGMTSSAAAQFPSQPVVTPAPAPAPAPVARAPRPAPKPMGRAARPGEVETVPIKCWWKTDTTEVRVGQRFTLTLTCGVIETPSLKVTANTNALDPGALQVTPFEVASGERRDDILSPPWRYFQYEYKVRLLNEGFFGQDVTLPPVSVTYNIQAAAGNGVQGRDLTYALPGLPMRVASIVPRSATDIRDVGSEGFDTIATRRFRASIATVAGFVAVGFAALMAALAVARAFGRFRRRTPAAARPLASFSVFGASLSALSQVRSDAGREGWSPALVRRALAAVRVGATVGIGRPLARADASDGAIGRDGQLVVRQGLIRRRRLLVSASATGHTVEKALLEDASLRGSRPALATLASALRTLEAAAFGRTDEIDALAVDSALSASVEAIKQLRVKSLIRFGGPARRESAVRLLGSPSMSGDRA